MMTIFTTASAPIASPVAGATVRLVPVSFDAEWLTTAITKFGPLNIARIVELSGRSETTARKLTKKLVEEGTLVKNTGGTSTLFELPAVPAPKVADVNDDDAAQDKIDEIFNAITSEPKPKLSTRSKKIAHTTVPDEHTTWIAVGDAQVSIIDAYAKLVNPPMFATASEAFAWANTFADRSDNAYTPEEIAAEYFRVVTAYLDVLAATGTITPQVWYGRTFRLRRTLIGHGKGTASARPSDTSADQ